MTQQPPQRIVLRAADIAQAIMASVVESQTTYTYLAAVLMQQGGSVEVSTDTLEKIKNEENWEVAMEQVGQDAIQFRLLTGAEQVNAALGRTPGGIIVP